MTFSRIIARSILTLSITLTTSIAFSQTTAVQAPPATLADVRAFFDAPGALLNKYPQGGPEFQSQLQSLMLAAAQGTGGESERLMEQLRSTVVGQAARSSEQAIALRDAMVGAQAQIQATGNETAISALNKAVTNADFVQMVSKAEYNLTPAGKADLARQANGLNAQSNAVKAFLADPTAGLSGLTSEQMYSTIANLLTSAAASGDTAAAMAAIQTVATAQGTTPEQIIAIRTAANTVSASMADYGNLSSVTAIQQALTTPTMLAAVKTASDTLNPPRPGAPAPAPATSPQVLSFLSNPSAFFAQNAGGGNDMTSAVQSMLISAGDSGNVGLVVAALQSAVASGQLNAAQVYGITQGFSNAAGAFTNQAAVAEIQVAMATLYSAKEAAKTALDYAAREPQRLAAQQKLATLKAPETAAQVQAFVTNPGELIIQYPNGGPELQAKVQEMVIAAAANDQTASLMATLQAVMTGGTLDLSQVGALRNGAMEAGKMLSDAESQAAVTAIQQTMNSSEVIRAYLTPTVRTEQAPQAVVAPQTAEVAQNQVTQPAIAAATRADLQAVAADPAAFIAQFPQGGAELQARVQAMVLASAQDPTASGVASALANAALAGGLTSAQLMAITDGINQAGGALATAGNNEQAVRELSSLQSRLLDAVAAAAPGAQQQQQQTAATPISPEMRAEVQAFLANPNILLVQFPQGGAELQARIQQLAIAAAAMGEVEGVMQAMQIAMTASGASPAQILAMQDGVNAAGRVLATAGNQLAVTAIQQSMNNPAVVAAVQTASVNLGQQALQQQAVVAPQTAEVNAANTQFGSTAAGATIGGPGAAGGGGGGGGSGSSSGTTASAGSSSGSSSGSGTFGGASGGGGSGSNGTTAAATATSTSPTARF